MVIRIGKLKIDSIIWVVTVLFLTLICVLSTEAYGSLVLLGCAVVIFLLTGIRNRGRIYLSIDRFHWYWLVFALYALTSSLWAWEPDAAVSKGVTLLELLVCMSMIYVHYQQEEDLWPLYNAVRWSGFLASIYTVAVYGAGNIWAAVSTGGFVRVDFANVNEIAIMAAFSVVITMYEVLFRRMRLLTVLLTVVSVVVLAGLGTRKALLIVLAGLALLLYFRYRSKDFVRTALKMLFLGILAGGVVWHVLSQPMFSGVMDRMERMLNLFTGEGAVDSSTLLRSRYIQVGMEQFWKTPLFGIGIGNSGELLRRATGHATYLHNNFVELLCCGGVVGFSMYYAMLADSGWHLMKHEKGQDALVKLGLAVFLIFVAMDMAMVSYYSKTSVFYTMMFSLQARQLRKRERESYESE